MSCVTTSAGPIVAISPHYDDAVFSCGHLLSAVPTSKVITVFTAPPNSSDILTDWDRRCGFTSAAHAMHTRRAENSKALAVLQTTGIDLDFLDAQYPQPPSSTNLLIDAFAMVLSELQPLTVFFPLGLFHSDHIRVSDAVLSLGARFDSISWIAYEDIPYSRQRRCVNDRILALAKHDIRAVPIDAHPAKIFPDQRSNSKKRAVHAYESQLLGLGCVDARPILTQPERYWQVQVSTGLL